MKFWDEFAASLEPSERDLLAEVERYAAWRTARQRGDFVPAAADDVELRNYLLELRTRGANRQVLRRALEALKRLYAWAQQQGVIASNPFDEFNFDRPLISREQIRRRQSPLGSDRQAQELGRLRALNRLAEALHRAPDVRSTVDAALSTLAEAMGLKSAWAFLHTGSGLAPEGALALHDYALAGAYGLPPGLEQRDRFYLRCSPDCHCQSLLRSGRLVRAVNVVECTRLEDAAEAQGDNQNLLFHATVPLHVQGEPVGLLNYATEEWQFLTAADLQLLSAVGAHVSLALERARLFEETRRQRERLQAELDMARVVQSSLLPSTPPEIPGFRLAAHWRAALETAGDFYDWFPLPGNRWALIVADVSDKGAPAALYMAMVRSLVRARAEQAVSPAALLEDVNRALCRHMESGMFVTVFYAVLDPLQRTLTYANAGHNPPLLRRGDGRLERLPRGGLVLGVLENMRWEEHSLSLGQGDALVMYTDGVTEALNAAGEEFGAERLAASLRAAPPGARPVLSHLERNLTAFTGPVVQRDDITFLVLACSGAA